jgi:hypothetical protein
MMVISPSFGWRLSNGMYCLIARCKTSFCDLAVARTYSRMCWHSKTCSLTSKTEDISGDNAREPQAEKRRVVESRK